MNAPTTEPTMNPAVEFAREELAGKLLAMCVGQLEKLKTPWNMTSESGQAVALNAIRGRALHRTRRRVGRRLGRRHKVIRPPVQMTTLPTEWPFQQ